MRRAESESKELVSDFHAATQKMRELLTVLQKQSAASNTAQAASNTAQSAAAAAKLDDHLRRGLTLVHVGDDSRSVRRDCVQRSAAIAKAILELCAGLQLQVTVEGIETLEQFAWMLGRRNVYLQGYLLSVPVSGDEIVPLMPMLLKKMQDLLLTAGSATGAAEYSRPYAKTAARA